MSIRTSRPATRQWIAGIVLAAVALRALIPSGFMPVPGHLLSLELCPGGLPAGMLAAPPAHMPADMGHGPHRPGAPFHVEHCAFGSAPGAAPLPQFLNPTVAEPPRPAPAATFDSQQTGGRLAYVPLSRGPPHLV